MKNTREIKDMIDFIEEYDGRKYDERYDETSEIIEKYNEIIDEIDEIEKTSIREDKIIKEYEAFDKATKHMTDEELRNYFESL